MARLIGWLSVLGAVCLGVIRTVLSAAEFTVGPDTIGPFGTAVVLRQALLVGALVLGLSGLSLLLLQLLLSSATKRRAHDIQNVLRLIFGTVGLVAVLGVLTK